MSVKGIHRRCVDQRVRHRQLFSVLALASSGRRILDVDDPPQLDMRGGLKCPHPIKRLADILESFVNDYSRYQQV
jgi:hypothetical protein